MNETVKSIKLKVELCGGKSVRHVVVPENITLVALHEVIQAIFAWENEHLAEALRGARTASGAARRVSAGRSFVQRLCNIRRCRE